MSQKIKIRFLTAVRLIWQYIFKKIVKSQKVIYVFPILKKE